ncbi:MAG: WG repeat-containing protein [Fluviicola sp.]
MKTKLGPLCFIFLCFSVGFAQKYEPVLQSFTDYAKCFYGLRDKSGKEIIWKAEFTSLHYNYIGAKKDQNGYQYFWMAEKNGYHGALDDSGKVVVPFQFEQVLLSRVGCFIAKKGKDVFVYSLSGEKKYSGIGVDEIRPLDQGYVVKRNGVTGFLDLQFREKIPFQFTDIKPVVMSTLPDSNIELYSPHTFHIYQGEEAGIYDLISGIIVPCKYEFAEVHWANEQCAESQGIYVAFRDTLLFMYNPNGSLVDSVSFRYPPVFYQVPFDSCASKADAFAVFHTMDAAGKPLNMRVINLLTKEQSKTYDWITAKGDRFLCKKGKQWSVVDANFRDIGEWSKWNASWEIKLRDQFNLYNHPHVWPSSYTDPDGSKIRNNKQIVIYSNPSKNSNYLSFGLLNYETDQQIPTDYFRIDKLIHKQEVVYWAYKIAKKDQPYIGQELSPGYSQLDIYDENLKLLRSFHGGDEMPYYESRERNAEHQLIIHPQGDYYGAINARGDQVIPARYKDFGEIVFPGFESGKAAEVVYLFGNNNQLSVFDVEGNQIISDVHSQYSTIENRILALNEDRTYAIYSKDGKKLLDEVNAYFTMAGNREKKNCSYLKGKLASFGNISFYAKQDYLYYFLGEKLFLADSETFDFSSAYLRLNHNLIINQQGKVVDVSALKLTRWYGGCPAQLQKLPVQEEKPERTTPKEKLISKNYQWKQLSDYKTKDNSWIVSDLAGRQLSNRRFDYPFNPQGQAGKIFRVNNQYGLMGENFKELLPSEYKYIYPVETGYILQKDSLWRFYKLDGGFSPEAYDAISTYTWKKDCYFVFKNGKIGVLMTNSWNYLVPMTDSLELVTKTDLTKLLQLDVSEVKQGKGYMELNNSMLVFKSYQYSTANLIMQIEPVDLAFLANPPKISLRYEEEISDEEIYLQNPNWFTKERRTRFRYLQNYYQQPESITGISQYFNYKIVNEKLVPVTLKNIIPTTTSMKKLNELLIQRLTKDQVFGQNCTDIAGKLEILKSNFLLTGYSIRFCWPSYPKFEIEFYSGELNGILSPEMQKQIMLQKGR